MFKPLLSTFILLFLALIEEPYFQCCHVMQFLMWSNWMIERYCYLWWLSIPCTCAWLEKRTCKGSCVCMPACLSITSSSWNMCGQIAIKSDMVNVKFRSNLPGCVGTLCKKLIPCWIKEAFRYIVSKRVTLLVVWLLLKSCVEEWTWTHLKWWPADHSVAWCATVLMVDRLATWH
jgi:hypothetical protein